MCVLAIGKLVATAEKAAGLLADAGHEPTVWDVRCCKPLDDEMIADAARHRAVVTIEDGIRDGGIGMAIADRIGAIAPQVPVEALGLPTRFFPHADRPEEILTRVGLDATGVVEAVRRFL